MKASFSSLPTEVIEAVILCTAAGRFPSAIGALSQTCRALYALIYQATDHHLWRAIFLSTFDDPRKLRYYDTDGFDWGSHFRERVWAASFLKRHVRPLRIQKVYTLRSRTTASPIVDLTSTYDMSASVKMLNTLLSVIKTTAPNECHHPLPGESGGCTVEQWEALLSSRSLSFAYHTSPQFPPRLGYSPCLNVPWLQAVLKNGLPASLITKISRESRGLHWDNSPEAIALGELITCTGFLPIRNVVEEQTGRLASSSSRRSIDGPAPDVGISGMNMSVDDQKARAHYRARELVYRMSYLSRRRHWGPYLAVAPTAEDEPLAALRNYEHEESAVDYARRTLLEMFQRATDELSESEDPDYIPSADVETGSSTYSDDGRPDDEDGEPPPVDLVQSRKRKRVVPTPEELKPDWTWLAAARVLFDQYFSDLEELNPEEFVDWNFWREAWASRLRDGPLSFVHDDGPVEGSSSTLVNENALYCRDWAGVQGVWRRAVLWLAYADLEHHNHFGGFDDPGLYECRIRVPMRLRVVGYGAPAVAAYPDRPTIIVEGEMGGQDFEGHPDDTPDDIRRVHGTVSMLSTGHVRWRLTSSSKRNRNVDQWASEGVQIGAVGSEAGVLGLWTGARHEGRDPIGPFWQWRVA